MYSISELCEDQDFLTWMGLGQQVDQGMKLGIFFRVPCPALAEDAKQNFRVEL
jgi:hypothetical protein